MSQVCTCGLYVCMGNMGNSESTTKFQTHCSHDGSLPVPTLTLSIHHHHLPDKQKKITYIQTIHLIVTLQQAVVSSVYLLCLFIVCNHLKRNKKKNY